MSISMLVGLQISDWSGEWRLLEINNEALTEEVDFVIKGTMWLVWFYMGWI